MVVISVAAQLLLVIIDPGYSLTIFGDKGGPEGAVLSPQRAWVSILIIFVFTLLTIRIVQKTRRDAKVALESYYQDMSKYKDHECLKARTLHIKGVLP
jgi:hypothetical protein